MVCESVSLVGEVSLQQQYLSLSSLMYAMCISLISWHGHVKPWHKLQSILSFSATVCKALLMISHTSS